MHMFDCGVSEEDRNWAEMPTSWRRQAQQGGSTNHAPAQRHSRMHAVTHQRWTIKQRGEGEGARRKWMISLVEVWGPWWTDMEALISCRKEIVSRFTDLHWAWDCPHLGHRILNAWLSFRLHSKTGLGSVNNVLVELYFFRIAHNESHWNTAVDVQQHGAWGSEKLQLHL